MIRVLAVLLALVALATGCSDDSPDPTSERSPATAAPPPPGPTAGACYRLGYSDALEASNSAPPVPCTGTHSAETVHVGHLQPLVDGHLLTLDSARVQRRIARTCRSRVDRHLGGSTETRRLSRLQAVWFTPTPEQGDAGALWFRCDLILLRGPSALGALPARTRGILARPGALNRFGTCGTAAPAAAAFKRVACSGRHTWRARATIALPRNARYLSKAVQKTADTRCRDIDAAIARNDLKLRWSFEWPTRAQWQQGQRYGLCWTPDPA